jgi:tRNA modification GTPase
VFSPTDTIVAIATPGGRGGIGVVRVSGPRAVAVARATLAAPHELVPRHATHTFVVPGIDEVVATYFPAPHSYTTEDVVEISAHGSPVVLRQIVSAAMAAGARLAEPGEFTFRAYLGGRIDLVQAEAVGDLVDAVTPLQARVAFDQLEGTLTRSIAALDAPLCDLVAKLEASIDFPDEGYHFIEPQEVVETLTAVGIGIDRLLSGAHAGRIIREGRQIAIVGRPNVGKSSLFNWLLGAERAIVTDIPGTTRDLLRETIDFDGVRLSLVDTAGIRTVQDEIEREGVARARQVHGVADLVLVVLDASRQLDDDDWEIVAGTAATPRLLIVNKTDLPRAWSPGRLSEGSPRANQDDARQFPGAGRAVDKPVEISLKTGAGQAELRAAIARTLELAEPRVEEPLVTNIRHESLLRDARESVTRALRGLEQTAGGLSEELVLADLAAARGAFDEVVGKRTTDDLLRRIFERFCVGK